MQSVQYHEIGQRSEHEWESKESIQEFYVLTQSSRLLEQQT
jgi:hypothetical protein